MCKIKIIFRDYYRFHFEKIKTKSIHDISIWKVQGFSIIERENRLKRLNNWLEINKNKDKKAIENQTAKSAFISSEILTDNILKGINDNNAVTVLKLFSLFNKKKYLPDYLTTDFKFCSNVISLKSYCNLSSIFLNEYLKTKNIQFLNTSLKLNDFLFYCQIVSDKSKLDGSIASYFPCYFNTFNIDYETNVLFENNIINELKILKSL